ncbi:MAG: dihydrolipoamide acetyltransferase family protein [Candidatus Aquicultor sp.]|nr:dihydrolipoamide acetyltransferase family protein [Candidatus Aquicultor sp.]
MTVPLTMPRLGETVTEGTILKWLKKEGETVEKDESIVEISTAKVETEIPSPVSGTVTKILVREEETVDVGVELALIDEAGAPRQKKPADTSIAPEAPDEKAPAQPSAAKEVPAGVGFASPVVRKLAVEHDINLALVQGTGAGGRITRKDVEEYIAAGKPAAATAAAPAEPKPAPEAVPPAKAPAPAAEVPPVEVPGLPGERIVTMSRLRREIAQHMVRSRKTAAHVTAIIEVDMGNIHIQRERIKETFKRREGFPITYLAFVAKATIDALSNFPTLNARIIDEQRMALHDYVNLGIAVAVKDGLIVPVIKGAENMSLTGLAREIFELADKARAGRLSVDEVTGSTFTITNPGSFGSIIQTPIINQPNVAILSLEAIQKRAIVIDDAIAIRHMVYMPLSYDHRIIDGAIAAQFLTRLKHNLETWDFTPDLASFLE